MTFCPDTCWLVDCLQNISCNALWHFGENCSVQHADHKRLDDSDGITFGVYSEHCGDCKRGFSNQYVVCSMP